MTSQITATRETREGRVRWIGTILHKHKDILTRFGLGYCASSPSHRVIMSDWRKTNKISVNKQETSRTIFSY